MIELDGLAGSLRRDGRLRRHRLLPDDVDALPPPATCTRPTVTWTLAGLAADSVLVRAFPVEEGVTPDGG